MKVKPSEFFFQGYEAVPAKIANIFIGSRRIRSLTFTFVWFSAVVEFSTLNVVEDRKHKEPTQIKGKFKDCFC